MKKFFLVSVFSLLAFSCSHNDESIQKQDLSFSEVEKRFNMKQPFTSF